MDENEPLEIAVDVADDGAGTDADPISELQRQRDELQGKLDAEKSARMRAEQSSHANYAANVDNYVASAEAAAQHAKQAYETAMSEGSWDKASQAVEDLTTAKAQVEQYRAVRANLQNQQVQRAQPTGNDVDTFISRLSGPSRDWAERHKADIANRLDEVGAAHVLAAKRHGVDNQNYFAEVERTLGIRGNNSRRSSAPVAPVSGSAMSGHGNMSGGTIRLSPGQVEMANSGAIKWNKADVAAGRCKPHQLNEPIGTREYGRRVLQMQRDGRMREPE